MRKNIDPFLYGLPEVDIHGHDRYSAIVEIKNFIEYCKRTGNTKFIIIHGKGSGILKKVTHEYLKSDSMILRYSLLYYNDGETIVELKEN